MEVADPDIQIPVETGEENSGPKVPPWIIYIEDALVVLCILPVWPAFILGWEAPVWKGLVAVDVVVLIVIFVRRWRRAKRALETAADRQESGPQLPFVPPGRKLQ